MSETREQKRERLTQGFMVGVSTGDSLLRIVEEAERAAAEEARASERERCIARLHAAELNTFGVSSYGYAESARLLGSPSERAAPPSPEPEHVPFPQPQTWDWTPKPSSVPLSAFKDAGPRILEHERQGQAYCEHGTVIPCPACKPGMQRAEPEALTEESVPDKVSTYVRALVEALEEMKRDEWEATAEEAKRVALESWGRIASLKARHEELEKRVEALERTSKVPFYPGLHNPQQTKPS